MTVRPPATWSVDVDLGILPLIICVPIHDLGDPEVAG